MGTANQRAAGASDQEDGLLRPFHEICDEMVRDVEREIDAARADADARALQVVAGTLASREGPYFIYRVRMMHAVPPIRAEQAVLAVKGDAELPAQVVGASGRLLQLAITREVADEWWPGAQIVVSAVWILEQLRARLLQIREGLSEVSTGVEFNHDLARLIIGEGDFGRNELMPPTRSSASVLEGLNEQQRDAVLGALTRKAMYLWGPPGTGKTTTLAVLIHLLVLAGERVLVTAPSNAAADVLTLALAERLSAQSTFAFRSCCSVSDRGQAARFDRDTETASYLSSSRGDFGCSFAITARRRRPRFVNWSAASRGCSGSARSW